MGQKWPNQVGKKINVFYGLLNSSYNSYQIMPKPFLYGGNHCVDDAHAGFFQNTNSFQRNNFLK